MVVIFGPAGAGKSVQGQILAARHGWRWLSAGQLLRDTRDHELLKEMSAGELVDANKVNQIVGKAIRRAKDIDHLIVDGFPRQLEQAQWLLDSQDKHGRDVKLVIVLDVSKKEVVRRLTIRGRMDDTPEAIEERLNIHEERIKPIIDYFKDHNVKVVHVDGSGQVGEVHDRIEAELKACSLV